MTAGMCAHRRSLRGLGNLWALSPFLVCTPREMWVPPPFPVGTRKWCTHPHHGICAHTATCFLVCTPGVLRAEMTSHTNSLACRPDLAGCWGGGRSRLLNRQGPLTSRHEMRGRQIFWANIGHCFSPNPRQAVPAKSPRRADSDDAIFPFLKVWGPGSPAGDPRGCWSRA
jgi:hypothetical protein